jgi:hypothetical protein
MSGVSFGYRGRDRPLRRPHEDLWIGDLRVQSRDRLARHAPAGFGQHSCIHIFFLKSWLGLVVTLFPGLVAWAVTAASAGLWLMVAPVIAILGSAALAAWRIADDAKNEAH